MSIDRRQFLKAVSAASLAVGITRCSNDSSEDHFISREEYLERPHDADYFQHEQVQWLLINPDSSVAALTGRAEMGQGSLTLMKSAVSQAMKLPFDKVEIIMGDTDVTPDNGPTNGSSTSILVVWPFWIACHKVIDKLKEKGAAELGISREQAIYDAGEIWNSDRTKSVKIGELSFDSVLMLDISPGRKELLNGYKDLQIGNVLGPEIVTGNLKYVGDLYPENVLYGGFLPHKYHFGYRKIKSLNFDKAKRIPGIVKARKMSGFPAVVGTSFSSVQKALQAVDVEWKVPNRPKVYEPEKEIRAGRKLAEIIQDQGDPKEVLKNAKTVITDTYMTHLMTHCPIETDSAVANSQPDGSVKVWVSSQYPHGQQRIIADRIGKNLDDVHVEGMPVGGGYGGKISNAVAKDTAALAQTVDAPVKVIYSRENQFVQYSRLKDIVIVDFKTAVDESGKLLAREVDIHQDEGLGISKLYNCPNSVVRHFQSEVPLRHAVIRGTSYIQGVFALESHMDDIANRLKMDPLEFRKKNVKLAAHKTLLDKAAEMIGYGKPLPADTGIGMAIVNHGSEELGAVFSKVFVDRKTGKVTVEKICGAFDIGKVMNIRTCRMGAEGAFIWGIGYALLEQAKADGHSIQTTSMWDYDVPRFENLPDMEMEFFEVHPQYGGPRGIGEMPMVPVTPSIGNAIFDAVGIRFRETPFKPERVLQALNQKS